MVPQSLRFWFVIHFVFDFVLGVPLLVAPVWFLTLFGFENPDPFTARLVGAALLGMEETDYYRAICSIADEIGRKAQSRPSATATVQ